MVDVPKNFPALIRAEKVQKKAKAAGFDWDSADGAFSKVYEEIEELKEAYKNKNQEEISEEFGDLLFAVVNAGRFLGVDPELSLTDATNKFINRFSKMENLANSKNQELDKLTLEEMDAIWSEVKKLYEQ